MLGITMEHEIEPVPGLPARLPANERILWQGAPDAASFRRACFFRTLCAYFAVMVAWTVIVAFNDRAPLGAAALGIGRSMALAGLCLGLVALFARATARTTLYTVTNRRVVLRFGLALPMTVNLPFAQMDGVSLRMRDYGTGDLVLAPTAKQRIAYLVMWPHTRPGYFKRAQPMLRSIPDAARVARVLSQAFAAEAGAPMEPVRAGRQTGRDVASGQPVAA